MELISLCLIIPQIISLLKQEPVRDVVSPSLSRAANLQNTQRSLSFSHSCQSSHHPVPREFNQLYFGTPSAVYRARLNEKEDTTMNTTLSRKTAYIGAGAGIVLFAIFGLLPGSLLGGAAGIKLAGMLFGLPLESGIVSRMIVLASMLVGVMASGITIVTATTAMGWLAGAALQGEASGQTAAISSK
jgi:hypothetical protein